MTIATEAEDHLLHVQQTWKSDGTTYIISLYDAVTLLRSHYQTKKRSLYRRALLEGKTLETGYAIFRAVA